MACLLLFTPGASYDEKRVEMKGLVSMCQHIPRPVWLLSIALAALAAAACDSSPSPISPSGSSFPDRPGSTSGATIQGQIMGVGGAAATSLRSAMANDDAIQIEVVGTNVSDHVDSDGKFLLLGVPASPDVVLRVSSPTLYGTVSLGEVSYDETVTLVLAVDNGVEVVSESRDLDDGDVDDVDDGDVDDDDVDD